MTSQAATHPNLNSLQKAWTALDKVLQIRPIKSAREYNRTVDLMNRLLDVVGDDTHHPLASLLDLLSELVEDYDYHHHAITGTPPHEVLRYLMDERGLKQLDLSNVVAQSNLSTILAGKRHISATLAVKLGKFFNISPAAFLVA